MKSDADLRQFAATVVARIMRYRGTAVCLAVLGAVILIAAARAARVAHAAAYLAAMLISGIVVEVIARRRAAREWLVKDKRRESRTIALALAMSTMLAVLRFIVLPDVAYLAPLVRAGLLVLMVLFVYPVFLLVDFVLRRRYRLGELGVAWSGAWAGLPVIAIIGVTAAVVVPQNLQFREMYQRSGILSMLFLGFGTAAFPEEFVRVLTQTRLAALLGSRGMGWFAASALWALMHVPVFVHGSGSFSSAIMGAVGILPIGLLWGYSSQRLGSIVPAVLVHGTNLWGLQNLF